MTGKGDSPRPLSVSDEQFGENFDRIDWSGHRMTENERECAKVFHGLGQHATAIGIECGVLGVIDIDVREGDK